MLFKRHFVAIAKILAGEYAAADNVLARATVDAIARSLADLFVAENARFNRGRFYHAVGIPLSPLRCLACGVLHYTSPRTQDTKCLYCGCPHRLHGKRWVRT